MPKLIVRMFGGLGNQMFIYAAARALSERTGAVLALDTTTGFSGDAFQRKFALHSFRIRYSEATAMERFELLSPRFWRYSLRRLNHFLPFKNRFYLTDTPTKHPRRFLPELLSFQPGYRVWMEGYWQSPLYFNSIRPILVRELSVGVPLSAGTQRVEESIRSRAAVCLHLRIMRDHVGNASDKPDVSFNLKYFLSAMDAIADRIEGAHFFCFSDNPSIASKLSNTKHPFTIVNHNAGDSNAHEDFHLMQQCRHFILSNSTFGWWPAWLSSYSDSVVMAPPVSSWDNQDILPATWRRLG